MQGARSTRHICEFLFLLSGNAHASHMNTIPLGLFRFVFLVTAPPLFCSSSSGVFITSYQLISFLLQKELARPRFSARGCLPSRRTGQVLKGHSRPLSPRPRKEALDKHTTAHSHTSTDKHTSGGSFHNVQDSWKHCAGNTVDYDRTRQHTAHDRTRAQGR